MAGFWFELTCRLFSRKNVKSGPSLNQTNHSGHTHGSSGRKILIASACWQVTGHVKRIKHVSVAVPQGKPNVDSRNNEAVPLISFMPPRRRKELSCFYVFMYYRDRIIFLLYIQFIFFTWIFGWKDYWRHNWHLVKHQILCIVQHNWSPGSLATFPINNVSQSINCCN